MSFAALLPEVRAGEAEQKQRRQDTVAKWMASASNLQKQIDYVHHVQKSLGYMIDPNTGQAAPGHEQEVQRYRDELKNFNLDQMHGDLANVNAYIQKMTIDPHFNPDTGAEARSPLRALGEKLGIVKPQAGLTQEQQTTVPSPTGMAGDLTFTAPVKKTAGEMIKDLQGIRAKYDDTQAGVTAGEKQLGEEDTQRQAEEAFGRDLKFKTGLAKEYGADPAEVATAALTGIKTLPKVKTERVQGMVDGQPVTWLQHTDADGTASFTTLAGIDVPPEELDRFQMAPKGGNLKLGSLGYFLQSAYGPTPTAEQQAKGAQIWKEAQAIERTSTGTFRWQDNSGKWWDIPTTHTTGANRSDFKAFEAGATPPAAKTPGGAPKQKTPAAPKAPTAAAPPAAATGPATPGAPTPPGIPGSRFIGQGKDTTAQADAHKKLQGILGLQTQANSISEHQRQGMHVALEQHQMIQAMERATSGRFSQVAAQYMMQTGLANNVQTAMSQIFGSGELPADVWKQVLQAIQDQRLNAEEQVKASGLTVGQTAEEQHEADIVKGLENFLLNPQAAPPAPQK